MAWQDPDTYTAGQVLTAASLNKISGDLDAIGGAWTSYSPTLTQSGTVTKTDTYCQYVTAGKLVIVAVSLAVTGAGTTNNPVTVSLPVTAANAAGIVGAAFVLDANVNSYVGTARGASTTTVTFFREQGGGTAIGQSPNFALANGDVVQFSVTYEAA